MIDFHTHPDRYRHWNLSIDGAVATLTLAIDQDQPFAPGYELKLNSYDLSVDIELQDAIRRLRFEHPEVAVLTATSGIERIFSAGANIPMLASSTHPFKVNFCKFTNETRLQLEDAARTTGITTIAALNGLAAGGGYELAISCDEIYLVDDGNSAVSLPEVPLLGVLPGTGGLTRLVDKRKIRRDLADCFATRAEGVRGKKAKAWGLIDDYWPKSKFADNLSERTTAATIESPPRSDGPGIELGEVLARKTADGFEYDHVGVTIDERVATVTVQTPTQPEPKTPEDFLAAGDSCWAIRAFRELDDAICQLRFCHDEVGLLLLKTRGSIDSVLAVEETLATHKDHWLVREIVALIASVLRRWDLTGRSLFAVIDGGTAFGGLLFELALGCDRIYMLDDPDNPTEVAIGPLSAGSLPMSNGLSRLESRFLRDPDHAARLAAERPRADASEANDLGLVTVLADDLDWDDELRLAKEERASLSPDALTGMEASLRFGGPETCDSKIFGRLSAWQNWIFTRPNATGEQGALVCYGRPETASFDWRRT
ncbi:MAG: benzoyl-CoA-dihydrodiol lyase [Planctomycetes bacterium]|nr:benzoyl-CoA-dihydrodiol lyase [Planctomycetota bacterium]